MIGSRALLEELLQRATCLKFQGDKAGAGMIDDEIVKVLLRDLRKELEKIDGKQTDKS